MKTDMLEDRWNAQRFYVIVQDLDAGEERLVRQDGAHGSFPPDTLLPWAKGEKIKLAKEIDEPGRREFTFLLDVDQETRTKLPNKPNGYFRSREGTLAEVFGDARAEAAKDRLGDQFYTMKLLDVAKDIAKFSAGPAPSPEAP